MSSAIDMRHSSSSSSSLSSSSTSLSFTKSRRRKWSREELLRNLSILGPLSAPPAPELPPSPPASRSSSPALGSKRKAPSTDSDHHKRPRISGVTDRSSHHRPPPHPSGSHQSRTSTPSINYSLRSEPAEDGEVREDSASSSRLPSSATVLATTVPIRRPRRERPSHSHFDELHRKYYEIGRAFKFSGDARFWSTYPANHKEYRPLPNPPSPNSPYHKYGGLIARLELVDALVCFTYSIWSKEYGRRVCIPETWQTAQAFLSWCKAKWDTPDTVGESESAFLGLIYMIEGFIHARKFNYASKIARSDTTALWTNTRGLVLTAAREEGLKAAPNLLSTGSHLTPQGLPSPANSVPTNSAHSTPTNIVDRSLEQGNALLSTSARPPPQGSPSGYTQPLPFPPEFIKDSEFTRDGRDGGVKLTEQMAAAASKATIPVSSHFVNTAQSVSQGIEAAQYCMEHSQQMLTLPKMAQHFPTTFARMVYSNLGADEEYQPDMEDEEGELFWPGQCTTGEGLGWVCLMGKAMIHELGKDFGYIGLKGVIPKPRAEAQSGSMRGQPFSR